MKKLEATVKVNFLVSDASDHEEVQERLYERIMDLMETEELKYKILKSDEDEDEDEEI